MRRFAALYQALDASTATGDKVAALVEYFGQAAAADAAWAAYFLAGGKPRQVVPTAQLRSVACAAAGIDDWLFEECYQAVGDLGETLAHVWPAPRRLSDEGLAHWVEHRLLPLKALDTQTRELRLREAFDELDAEGRFLLVKLIGGGFRVGVSRLLVQRALAQAFGLDEKTVAQRMMGYTDARRAPDAQRFEALVAPAGEGGREAGHPYPFFLAHALPAPHEPETLQRSLGDLKSWLLEWKYDGIRAQVVRREGGCWIWSRGEELISDRFPELVGQAMALPEGCVLDGEILVWHEGEAAPASFSQLQTRITRKSVSRRLLAQAPARFVAYDLLEADGEDWRSRPQWERRHRLLALAALAAVPVSPEVQAADWAQAGALRAQARERGVEGLMLKQLDARYGSGRTRSEGLWWKWKVEPYTADAVLIYAQAGHGRRAGVYTDYTFAVWNRKPESAAEAQSVVQAIARREPPRAGALQLVAFAKAYSGLSDAEFARVDRVIRSTTLESFGPVRSVAPSLVFELGFEGLNRSARHKSGLAVRFPRMLRIRDDKPLHEADTLDSLCALLPDPPATGGPMPEAAR